MFDRILQLFKSRTANKKECRKEDEFMVTKTMEMPRVKISSAEFDKHTAVGEIRRIGKRVVIVDERGSLIPISRKYVKELKASALQNRRAAIIKATGLSRAQIGRIAGDLRDGYPGGVYIRRVSTPKFDKPQATNYEILLMDGNSNEKK